MIATHLGFYNTATSRTHVRFQFSTHASAGANVAPNSAFEAADIRIYRAANGAAFSATQRASANGVTMTSPFDSLVGYHDVDIDLTDNSDAGFYAAGYLYAVVLAPDETVDGQTLTGVVLAYFEIGRPQVDVHEYGGSAGTFASGRPEVNTTHIGGTVQTANDVGADVDAILVDTGTTLQGELDGIQADTEDIQTRLPASLVSGRMDASVGAMAANVLTATAIADDAITAAKIAADAIGSSELAASAVTEIQSGLSTLDAAGVRSAVGLASANLDTQLAAIAAFIDTEVATLLSRLGVPSDLGSGASLAANLADIESQTDDIGAAGAGLTAITGARLGATGVDDILDEQIGDSTITVRQALKVILASAAGKLSGAATTTVRIRDIADTLNRIDATVDADGNRTAVNLNV